MENTKYLHFSIEAFAKDTDFRRWVLHPSPEDLLFWQDFLAKHSYQMENIMEAERLVKASSGVISNEKLTPVQKKKLHQRLMKKVGREKSRKRLQVLALAATILLLLVAGFTFWGIPTEGEPSLIVIKTPYGQTKEVVLPDQSKVILNANSILSYKDRWIQGEDRLVSLKGEAHFTVTSQPATQAKFTVVTEDLKVNVLGTIFNVYSRKKGTTVTLEEGHITLDLKAQLADKATKVMVAGEQLHFSAQTGELKEDKVNVIAHSSWKDGIITFDGITLGQLGVIITETFGMRVEFKDIKRSQQIITGAGPIDDLTLLLETVEKAFQIEIIQQDSLLVFE